jgi:hypothetical protein
VGAAAGACCTHVRHTTGLMTISDTVSGVVGYGCMHGACQVTRLKADEPGKPLHPTGKAFQVDQATYTIV